MIALLKKKAIRDLSGSIENSPVPQAIVDRKSRLVIQSNPHFDSLTKSSSPTETWWSRLNWIDQKCYQAFSNQEKLSSGGPIQEILLRSSKQIDQKFKILLNELGSVHLLTLLPIEQPLKDTELFKQAFESTGFRTSKSYFHFYAEALCQSFKMDYAIIARLNDDGITPKAQTLSLYSTQEGFLPNIVYDLADTPCWTLYHNPKPICIMDNLQQAFPKDLDLITMGVVSYLGLPILDENNQTIGHLALLSSEPIKEPTDMEQMFLEIFAARSNAEFQRSDIEAQLHTALAEAKEANQAKTRFLANMSHEFRSPLNAILGYSQLLDKNNTLGDTEHQQVASILRNSRQILLLINDILNMSRIELNHVEIIPHPFSLSLLHQDIQTMFCPDSLGLDCLINFEIAEGLPKTIVADEGKIRQILTNLMSNAVKYGDGIQIKYKAEKKKSAENENESELLVFTVYNTGPAISDADQQRLFLPFERGTKQVNAPIDGTGLGLSIARSFAHAMDGDITLDNQANEGTSFILTVPFVEDSLTTPNEPPLIALEEKTTTTGTVLIVDDNEASRDIVRQVLQGIGLKTIEAADGIKGIETCLKERPDLVLMDVRMPHMSGLEASQQIRSTLKENCPPIIGLTGDLPTSKESP